MLMCLASILNCQIAKTELRLDALQEIVIRIQQADPHDMARLLRPRASVINGNVGHMPTASVHTGRNHADLG
jgi:hypothetical protein